jgi:hypothetical protein
MHSYWLLTQADTPVSPPLLQYGALGVLAMLLVVAIRELWTREKARTEKEARRADRLEEQLIELHGRVSNELAGGLVRATEAMREMADLLKYRGDR